MKGLSHLGGHENNKQMIVKHILFFVSSGV